MIHIHMLFVYIIIYILDHLVLTFPYSHCVYLRVLLLWCHYF